MHRQQGLNKKIEWEHDQITSGLYAIANIRFVQATVN